MKENYEISVRNFDALRKKCQIKISCDSSAIYFGLSEEEHVENGGCSRGKVIQRQYGKKKKKALERQKAHSDKANVFLLLTYIGDRYGTGHFYWNKIVD